MPRDAYWEEARPFLLAAVGARLRDADADLREELAQEAWVRLLRYERGGGAPRNREALMTTFAGRVVASHLRHMRVRRACLAPDDGVLEQAPSPVPLRYGTPPEARIEFLAIAFLEKTSAPCLELARHYFAGRNWAEVARLTGRTRDAVARQWSRCVETMRSEAAVAGTDLNDLGDRYEGDGS